MSETRLFAEDRASEPVPDILTLNWQGPFRWFGRGEDSIFAGPCSQTSGVYVWTVPIRDRYRVFYVGQTEAGFAHRHHDHFMWYFKGAYSIYEPEAFARGELVQIYQGFAYRNPAWKLARDYYASFESLVGPLVEHLSLMRMFIAELPSDRRLQRRVETRIMQLVYANEGPEGRLLEPGLKLEPRFPEERPVLVRQAPGGLLEGVSAEFEA